MQGYFLRLISLFLLWLGLAALPGAAAGRSVLELDTARQPVALLDWGDAWIDETGRLSAEEVATGAAPRWVRTDPAAIYPLTTAKALWIRFTVPPAPDQERWYLVVPYPQVNRVTLYTPDSLGILQSQSAGDTVPVTEWPVPHRYPLMPIQVSAEEPRKYLLRVENSHSFSAPVTFLSESYLSWHEQRTSLVLGIFFGLAGLAATLALLSAVSLRDSSYALYAASVAMMALTQASLTGIAGLHLWTRSPHWNDLASMMLPILTAGSVLCFLSAVLSLAQRSRALHLLTAFLASLSLVAAVAAAMIEPSHRFKVVAPYVLAAAVLAGVNVMWAARRGDRWAGWLLAASAPLAAASAFPLARMLGLIPNGFLTAHAMQFAIALELPMVLIILLLRSQQRREHNRRIQGLDRIDPATGLINDHAFHERLGRSIELSQRLKLRSAVMLVDITNVEQIRAEFGPRSLEELPLRVAGRLLSVARQFDTVARLAEYRFGLIVEGPLSADDITAAGPRVVARCLMPFKNKPLEWIAQVRVAQALVPVDGSDPDVLMGQLEVLLASVPRDAKRAVFNLSKSSSVPA